MRWTLEGEWVTTLSLVGLVSGTKLRRVGRNTQFGGAGSGQVTDTFSAPLGETLLLFPPQPYSIIQRARDRAGSAGVGGWVVEEEKIKSARLLPLESLHLAEGGRDQSSCARRGLPPKGEARALHHQPAPASTLTTPCSLLCLSTSFRQVAHQKTTVRKIKVD